MLWSWENKKEKIKQKFLSKKLFVFDLDGTISPSKGYMSKDMEMIIFNTLRGLGNFNIAVISGCRYEQMYEQFARPIIDRMRRIDRFGASLHKLYLLPTSGAAFYKWNRSEQRFGKVYKETLSLKEKFRIMESYYNNISASSLPNTIYGEIAEDRESQITFSLCGQDAPLEVKSKFDPDNLIRGSLSRSMASDLPDFRVAVGGTTSIDITRKGIDKAYGVNRLLKHTHTFKKDAMFIGDALQDGGNDAPVKALNIDCVSVRNEKDTYEFLVFLAKEVLAERQIRELALAEKQYKSLKRRIK